jgi:hypothetical protein
MTEQRDNVSPFVRLVPAVLALLAFPVVTFLVAMGLAGILVAARLSVEHIEGELLFTTVTGAIVGLATSVFIVWKSGSVLHGILALMRSRLPEPFVSCLEFSVTGAFLFGGVMLAVILLLGHTRPIGWNFDRILPTMGFGFVLFFAVGLPVGLVRKRRRN